MKLATAQNKVGTARCAVTARAERAELRRLSRSAFTLAETMAALAFMAIVIPAAVEALHVASGAGEIAVRKGEASHVAERVLNQSLVMTNWSSGAQSGTADEGPDEFRWTLSQQRGQSI